MLRPKLYEKTVTILCHSYSNGTLQFGSIIASPIGNLIAANLNYSVRRNKIKIPERLTKRVGTGDKVVDMAVRSYRFDLMKGDKVIESSFDKFFSASAKKRRRYLESALIEIDATGYSIDDLFQVDYAFQDTCKWGKLEEEVTLIAGLIAAVNALREIHRVPKEAEPLPVFKNIKLETSDHIVDLLEKRFKSKI